MIRAKITHWRHLTRLYQRSGFIPPLYKLLRGIAAAVIGTSLSMILSAVAQTLIVRNLSVMLYGEYAAIAATLGLMSIMLGFGLDTWILHDVSRNPGQLTTTIRSVLVLKAVGATLLLIIVTLAWSVRIVSASAFLIGAIGIVFDTFAMTGYSTLRALKKNDIVALFQTLGATLQLVLILFFMYTLRNDITLIFGLQTFSIICITFAIFWHLRQVFNINLSKKLELLRAFRGSWLLVTSDALAKIYGNITIAVLGLTVGTDSTGVFRSALNIVFYTFIVPNLISLVGIPILNEIRSSPKYFLSLTKLMILIAFIYGFSAIFLLRMWGNTLIDIIYKSSYKETPSVIYMIDIIILLKSINMVFVSFLIVLDRLKWRIFTQILITFYSILGSLFLIPTYGILGAAIITITIEILLFIGYGIGALRALRLNYS